MQYWEVSEKSRHRREQQDFHLVKRGVHAPDDMLMVVADGHRKHGAAIARQSVMGITEAFIGMRDPFDREAVRHSFEALDEYLSLSPEAYDGGSTLTIAYLAKGKMLVANVGDSPAELVMGGRSIFLTEGHTTLHRGEVARMREAGCRVEKGSEYFTFLTAKEERDIAVSRAFGDADLTAVIATPFVNVLDIPKKADYLLVGTDGVELTISKAPIEVYRLLLPDLAPTGAEAFMATLRSNAAENLTGVLVRL